MPQMNIRLAWATPFNAIQLGAHIQAYLNATPKIEKLRLCNRFGRGRRAFITKLPVELIDMIANVLMEAERTKMREEWSQESACWTNDCEPTDHYSASQCKDLLRKSFDEGDIDEFLADIEADTFGVGMDQLERKLTAQSEKDSKNPRLSPVEMTVLNGHLRHEAEVSDEEAPWMDVHGERQVRWLEKVGFPGRNCRGWSHHSRDQIVKNFGLELWTAHYKFVCPVSTTCDHRTTMAYLTLPVPEKIVVPWSMEEEDEDGERMPSEDCAALSVAIPTKPRASILSAFPRAMNLLNIKVLDLSDKDQDPESPTDPGLSKMDLAATKDDLASNQHVSTWLDKHGKEHISAWPRLTMLVINSDCT